MTQSGSLEKLINSEKTPEESLEMCEVFVILGADEQSIGNISAL